MFLLKKLFQLRGGTNKDDAEKPFLEHLEDLRTTLTRMTIVLLITTVTCFLFRNDLMEIIRRPVAVVWEASQKGALKDLDTKIDIQTWENAKRAARDAAALSPEQRTLYFEKASGDAEDLPFHAESVVYFRAALAIPDESLRQEFVDELPGIDERMRKQVKSLLVGNPEAGVDARGKLVLMQALNPTEGFMLSIKLAFFAGIVIAFPFLLYYLLQFILPGLHGTERRALFPAMAVGFGLFLIGVFFAYFYVLPRVLEFFYNFSGEMGIENEWRIGYYISFATQFTLIFGLSFELPVVVMTLVKLGIMNYEMMKKTRSYAILAIFVIAAIITPTPDAFTLCLLAGPMVILYEICIWLAYFINKKEREQEAQEEKERMERLLTAGPPPPSTTPAPGTEPATGDEDGHPDEGNESGEDNSDDLYHYDDEFHSDDEYGADFDYGSEGGETDEDGVPAEADQPAEEDQPEGDGQAAWRKTLGSDAPETDDADLDPPGDQSAKQAEQIQPEFELGEPDPTATEEGEEEDISDPWDEDEEEK